MQTCVAALAVSAKAMGLALGPAIRLVLGQAHGARGSGHVHPGWLP